MTARDLLGAQVADYPVPGPHVAKSAVGYLMERIVARVLGARVWDAALPPFAVPRAVATETDGTAYGLLPDVWWGQQSALVEVKAGIDRFFTTERQWNAYRWARDTQVSGLPVERPRVFYAFVAYSLDQRTDRYGTAHAVMDAALRGLRYLVVADSGLVESFVANANHRGDQETPLSGLLGNWSAHWSIRTRRLQVWAEHPRVALDANGLTRWRSTPLRPAMRIVAQEMAAAGFAEAPDIPAVVLAPCRPARPGPDVLPGEQVQLLVACPTCGVRGPAGDCAACGGFNAF